MSAPKIAWNTVKLRKLKELTEKGFSVGEILGELDFKDHTRNSIIGMCYRMGYKLTKKYQQKKQEIEQKPPAPKVKFTNEGNPVMFPATINPAVERLRASLLNAHHGQCRYLVGGLADDGTPYVCGMSAEIGSSWCRNHKSLCYTQIYKSNT